VERLPTDELPADQPELGRLLRALRLLRVEPASFLERVASYQSRVRSLYERAIAQARRLAVAT
jgi:hypothetical protein